MTKKRILLVEDEVKLARFVELELKYEGYEVDIAHDGKRGLELFAEAPYDLILLDLMLPNLNGIEVCRRIRKSSQVPIIMLTAKGEVMDKVTGLDSGADDYVTKPFAIEEVLARMRVCFKHQESLQEQNEPMDIYTLDAVAIDEKQRTVTVGGDIVELTKTEFELLFYLVKNKNIVLTREQILNQVWGYEYVGETNIVDVYIRYLRTKIDDKYNKKYIHTVRGVGYIAKESEK